MIEGLIYLVIYVIVIALVIWLLLWLIEQLPLPEPFGRVARIVLLVVGILIVILLLLQFAGIVGGGRLPRLGSAPGELVSRG
jgi:uncharacterized protein YhhL (DUF1145 family)